MNALDDVARAIHAEDGELEAMGDWDEQYEQAQDSYRDMAHAAVDAIKKLRRERFSEYLALVCEGDR